MRKTIINASIKERHNLGLFLKCLSIFCILNVAKNGQTSTNGHLSKAIDIYPLALDPFNNWTHDIFVSVLPQNHSLYYGINLPTASRTVDFFFLMQPFTRAAIVT